MPRPNTLLDGALAFLLPLAVTASTAFAGIEDCNQNGIDDGEDIALGISEDCQGNGIPDECELEELDRFYQADTGALSGAVGTNLGNTQTICWLVQYIVEPGKETINGVEIVYGVLDEGSPVTVAIWKDLGGDGIPFDAELLVSVETVSGRGWVPLNETLHPIPETYLGEAGTSVFIGVWADQVPVAPGAFPAAYDDNATLDASWWIATIEPFNPNDLANNAAEFSLLSELFADFQGDWLIRGTFCAGGYCGTAADLNENGVPDECDPDCNANGLPDDYEIINGLAQDCNGNGQPDECDLEGGDCDGDGVLDVCQAGLNGLVGQYFANEDLLGTFRARIDDSIDFLSQGEANLPAGIPDNDFSARWLGSLVPNESGLWKLGAFHDDGVRIWLDGEQIVNYWGSSPGTETLAELELEAGRGYHLRVEYVQYTGEAKLQLLWQAPSASEVSVVPVAALRPTFDRNGDGVADLCAESDCDGDYLPDGYQIELDAAADCNGNLVLDACEQGGDCDGDGILDACGAVVPHGLVAEYFDSSDNGRLTERLASAIVANIDFEFDGGSPNGVDGLGNDEYGIRFTGILTAPVSGTFQFLADADDGVRLWIGDEVVIEHWENGNGTYSGFIDLEAGWAYAFRMEWFEGIGGARVILRWVPPGGSAEVVPTEAFRPILDLDANGVPDACDVDCDGDGISDGVAIAEGLAEDCNANGIPDSCDVAAVPASETIAYWRFENAKAIGADSGPLGLDASNNGGSSQALVPVPAIPSTGAVNTGSVLLGNAGRLIVADPSQHLSFFDEAFTVEAWVRLDQLGGTGSAGNRQWLACKKGATPDSQIDWGILVQGAEYASSCDEVSGRTANLNGRELVFTGGYGDGGGTNKWAVVSNLRIVDNGWNYVAVSFDPFNRICRFVLNDVYEDVSIESMQLFANAESLVIGGHPNATGGINQLLRGSIDELRISRGMLPLTALLAAPYAPESADTNGDGVPDECGSPCVGDVNGDGVVNGVDLGTVLAGWGAAGGGTASDLNSDGVVDGVDLGLVLAAWGGC